MKRYRLYHAPDGGTRSFCGDYETRIGAAMTAERHRPRGLSEDQWATARAAGHAGGLYAPDLDGTEDEDPLLWIDDYYVVRVTYAQ